MQGRVESKLKAEKSINEKIINMPQYIKQFYFSLNTKSHTTKIRYINNVIRFINYLSNNDIANFDASNLSIIDSYIIEEFMSSINYYQKDNDIKELSSDAKNCMYSSLSKFCKFLYSKGYIEKNPFNDDIIERAKPEEKEITFLSPDEVKMIEHKIMYEGTGNDRSKARQENWKYRDLLLFRIPVITGLRVKALSEINIKDIDFADNSIKVIEKGNIHKKIYIDETTRKYIRRWIREREDILGSKSCDALFISNRKERMTTRSIERIIEKFAAECTTKHITPHKLRSTCGTNLYQETHDIYLVAEVLGHKSTAPTKKYTKVFEENKKDAINVLANLYS